MIKRLILILTLFISFSIASNSLESKIAKLQMVPKAQRYKLMNQIKRELAKMNASQRNRAINKLKATIHNTNSGNMHGKAKGGHINSGSHMQDKKEHFINRIHLHKHTNKTKNTHNKIKEHIPQLPTEHKKPEEPNKPSNPRGSHGK